jgi:hypothetical protein
MNRLAVTRMAAEQLRALAQKKTIRNGTIKSHSSCWAEACPEKPEPSGYGPS